ncbi:hypothetical protein PAXRUDRAFT_393938 [Paxillus rubicundulus Ve08.2h10]|uniref:Uncharacterized protein n=1 Tax=Paxillus rubicundulus Ve08.2h10 TaxID=930991 RepID=A0A0D0DDD7_9AGAM|nr:hypothetical protein PAXRUDRAFT_393938 [Paxillus rubicundulus Ve08.2h10]
MSRHLVYNGTSLEADQFAIINTSPRLAHFKAPDDSRPLSPIGYLVVAFQIMGGVPQVTFANLGNWYRIFRSTCLFREHHGTVR